MDRIYPKSLKKRWNDPKGLIQVFTGPRQVGKTTAVISLMDPGKTVYASADLPTPPTADFIVTHWKKAREVPSSDRTLVLDEVQKIPRWSEAVKKMRDEDEREKRSLKVCLLGSSSILIEKGLSESLTGRFEMNYFPHWTYEECRSTFQASLEDYVTYGGYPKVYDLRDDPERLQNYIQDSIIEPSLGRDILSLHAVDKPALLRQLFWYVSRLPSQIVSYDKILGHLQGRGNVATLVHYAELLSLAFLVVPLSKFSARPHRTKRSLPKWIFPNPGLIDPAIKKEGFVGFVFENLVASHLLNVLFGNKRYQLQYWREENQEVDFILSANNEPLLAIEVKSGRQKKIPDRHTLEKKGMGCAALVVNRDSVNDFLKTTSVEEVLQLRK
jgi:predicted AAA+ superfamily ATPase